MGSIKNKNGMALLDVILAIAILALIMAVAVPNLGRFISGYQRKQFLSSIDSITQLGWQQALITGKVHKVLFDLSDRTITLHKSTGNIDILGNDEYVPTFDGSVSTKCSIPGTIEVKQFFIEGFDEIARYVGNKSAARIWFFIMPNGSAQKVVINIIDTSAKIPKYIGLVLNPLNARFYWYEDFQKP